MLFIFPFLYCNYDCPAFSPTASVSVSLFSVLGLLSATSLLLQVCFLCCCVIPPGLLPLMLLLCLLPLSGLPPQPPMLDTCCCVTKLKFRNTISGNFLRTQCQIISSSVFVKNKILKYKVSQLQLKTTLDNYTKKQTPILEMLTHLI